jgi:uncharacterized RDD family membrane protein YckC
MQADYKIIGGDGVEYGPATLEELRSWIRDGRVAGMTKVWRSDLAAWSPAARYTELGGELARLHAAASSSAKPCGFWARLGAYVIDSVFLGGMFFLVWSQLAVSQHWPPPAWLVLSNDPASNEAAVKQFVKDWQVWANHAMPIYYPIFFLYDVLMNGRFGATVGKMAIGARIVLWDGSPIGYRRAAWRWVAARVSDFFCFAGYLLIALRADKRGLHDLLAGTRVIYKP